MDRRQFLKMAGDSAIASTLAGVAGPPRHCRQTTTNAGPGPESQSGYTLPDICRKNSPSACLSGTG